MSCPQLAFAKWSLAAERTENMSNPGLSSSPLVSICIPTYRRAAFIGDTLRSVLAQTLSSYEVIVVDDNSPDSTADAVKRCAEPRIRYLRNSENLGVPGNLNYAMSLGRAPFLLLLEDHDLISPTYLEKTVALMEKYPSVGVVATGMLTINEHGQVLGREPSVNWGPVVSGRKVVRHLVTRISCPFSVTALIRRSATDGIEPLFDKKYWWYADQYLWLRLLAKCDLGYLPQPLLTYRTREHDHPLQNRFWESALCIASIYDDNWHLLHPTRSISSCLDRFLAQYFRARAVFGYRAGKLIRGERWNPSDRAAAREYLSATFRVAVGILSSLPPPLLRCLRRWYTTDQKRRRALPQNDAMILRQWEGLRRGLNQF